MDLNGTLRDYVENVTRGYAFPTAQGALVVIDGLDEVERLTLTDFLVTFFRMWKPNPNITVVVTTRPLPGLTYSGLRINVPALDEQGVLQLISKVAGRTVELRELRGWVLSLQDAAKHPLFAIMIGAELRKGLSHRRNEGQSVGRPNGAKRVAQAGDHQDEMDELLQDLAVKAVSGGGSIASSDIHPQADSPQSSD